MNRLPLLLLLCAVGAQAILLPLVDWTGIERALIDAANALGARYNTMIVVAGTGLLGVTAGVVGAFGVLRRRALVGDAVAHAALPGLCIAFMLAGQKDFVGMMVGAAISGLLGVFIISWLTRHTRTKPDAAIGIVLACFFGLGIALSRMIQNNPTGAAAGLDSYLLGKTAGMIASDLLVIVVVALNLLVLVGVLFKEFKLISFDAAYASVQGWPSGVLDTLLMGAIVVATVIGLPAVGVVLTAALLILPGVTARFWTDRLGRLLTLAGVFGLITGVVGVMASAEVSRLELFGERLPSLPAGPMIVLTGTTMFAISMLIAPRRGVIARMLERARLERRLETQNLLRTMFEIVEEKARQAHGGTEAAVPLSPSELAADNRAVEAREVQARRSWSPGHLRALFERARRDGLVARVDSAESWRMTSTGAAQAAEIVRAHRLWDLVLRGRAGPVASQSMIDRDVLQVGDVLPPSMLDHLERLLRSEGRWPLVHKR